MLPILNSAMETVGLKQLYDDDPRPTFIVDCRDQPASLFHVNRALQAIPQIASTLGGVATFRDWWALPSRASTDGQTEIEHEGYRWRKFTTCILWLVVTATSHKAPSKESNDHLSPAMGNLGLSRVRSVPSSPVAETIFTAKIQSPELREHINYARQVDWASTSLGPISSWSRDLNQLVTLMMLETRPTALFLGPDNTTIYNLAYARVSGNRHPAMFGQNVVHGWPEIAGSVKEVIDKARTSSFADAPEQEFHHMIERNGYVEETFFLWSLVPLQGPVDGMYSIVTETTKQRLLERRVNALLRLGELTGATIELEAFWKSILRAIEQYEFDFPVAILYSITEPDTASSAGSGRSGSRLCALEGTMGYPEYHPAIPTALDLDDKDEPIARALSDSAKRERPTFIRQSDGSLPDSLFNYVEKRGFGDQVKAFIVCPVQPVSKDSVSGFLVIGLNTRRPYDLEYQEWIQVFSKLLGASAASVALHEDDIRSRKRAVAQAARDRVILQDELAVVTDEVNDVQTRLKLFHDVANKVGLGYFEYDISGKLNHANVGIA